jgi:hypothetical protein
MNNCEKLLRAFIEAQGYEVEDTITRSEFYATVDINSDGRPSAGSIPGFVSISNYKVTKKPFDINSEEYTDEMARLHTVIRESNEYNRRLYLESYDLKKELATLKTGRAHNENL